MQALNPATEFAYNQRVRELFVDLKHAGVLSANTALNQTDAVLCADAGSRERGATVRLCIELHDESVQTVRYQAYGCPHFLAACESLARWLEGRPVLEGRSWSRSSVEVELDFPVQKRARLLILEDALGELLVRAVAQLAPHPDPVAGR